MKDSIIQIKLAISSKEIKIAIEDHKIVEDSQSRTN